jgi:O-antigen ligase
LAAAPATQIMRATTFDPQLEAPGQQSLQSRQRIVLDSLKMFASDPIFGAGLGNFPWVARTYFGSGGHTHNSYLWALTSGGIGVLALYLLLFYVTYRMLKQLERSGPRELLWLSKGLKVNLLLFLVFSGFADMWMSDFLYLIIGLTTAMTYVWRRQEQAVTVPRMPGHLVT